MDTVYARCAGLDVHKKTVVVVTIRCRDDARQVWQQTRTYGTMTAQLLELGDWLAGKWQGKWAGSGWESPPTPPTDPYLRN